MKTSLKNDRADCIAIIANGQAPPFNLLDEYLKDVGLIIAVDGGSLICRQYALIPDYIIGDLDSIDRNTRDYFSSVSFIETPDQDFTDMQKTLRFVARFHPKTIRIFAAFGKRPDHSFGNLLIFEQYSGDARLEIYDRFGRLRRLKAGRYSLASIAGGTVSLFSLQPIHKLSLSGFKYEVSNQNFDPYFMGISNEYTQNSCRISFDSGTLFIYEHFPLPGK